MSALVRPARGLGRFRWISPLVLVVTGCGSGATPESIGADGAGPEVSAAAGTKAVLTFTTEDHAVAAGTVTLADGGTVSARAADGTTFELVVPPEAVVGDTEITLTPLTDVTGIGDGTVHAVQLEPDGLVFFEFVRLTITPAVPIAVADQLMFEASGDGGDAGPALIDHRSEPIVLLLDHFSVGGVASATPQQRAAFIEKSASNAESRINRQIAELAQQERARLLSGEPDTEADRVRLHDDVASLLDELEREVLERRRAIATSSCATSTRFIQTLLGLEQQRQRWGAADDLTRYGAVMDEARSALLESIPRCGQEAIQKCKEAEDPKILVRYWLSVRRTAELLSVPDVPVPELGDMPDRATEICEPQRYQFTIHYQSTSTLHASEWTISGNLVRYVEGMPIEADQPTDQFIGLGTYDGWQNVGFSCEPEVWSGSGDVYLTASIVQEGWPGAGFEGPALLISVFHAGEFPLGEGMPPYIDLILVAAPLEGGSAERHLVKAAEAECGGEWAATWTIDLAPVVDR